MKLATAISTSSLLLCVAGVGAGSARAQELEEQRKVESVTSTTTTTTPVEPLDGTKARKPAPTTNVKVNAPPAAPDATTTTKVQVDTPSETPSGTTNVEVTTPPASPTATPPAAHGSDNVVVTPLETPAAPAPAPIVIIPPPEKEYVERPVAHRIGAALTVGGGLIDFTGDNARDMTSTGGYWNARVITGTRQFVGVEAAYIGSARDVSALGLSNQAMLVGNGVEGALRLNVPIINGRSIVEPFAFAGVGWSRYNITNSNTNTSSLASSDDIMEIPYGGGVSFGYNGFIADARFTYRSTYYNDLMRTPSGLAGRLDNWSVGGQLGVEF